ncbi:unnamed protein product [Effrenium voratum]|uniref:Uncharacterized protein n=1 Tax=Effrenium voratum TaxID=2562239 RepID=A0AA36JGC7_9DINO|nr:unnamed protein product [Effrenium voratum]
MTAAVASYPGPYQERSSTPPSRCSYTPPSSVGRGSGALHFGGRPVATPLGLAALWEKEPIGKSAPAPSGPPLHRATHGASWGRGSTSPRRSPGPLMIRAEGSMEHTPRAGFQDSPRGPARRSATPSRLGFPDPKSPEREIRAERAVRQTSQSPRVPTLPGRNEDLIHQHVLYIMRKNPDVARSRKVQQVTEGVYLVDGHEVNIEWKHATEPGQRGCPMVVDGPMHQPLIDYLRYSEENKQYDLETVVCTTALHQVPKDKRMTFDDKHKQYSRLDAMKVAKEQACIREQAADYTLDGKQVPNELVRRYNKALRSKVRGSRKDDRVILAQEQEPAPHAGQPSPPVPAACADTAQAAQAAGTAGTAGTAAGAVSKAKAAGTAAAGTAAAGTAAAAGERGESRGQGGGQGRVLDGAAAVSCRHAHGCSGHGGHTREKLAAGARASAQAFSNRHQPWHLAEWRPVLRAWARGHCRGLLAAARGDAQLEWLSYSSGGRSDRLSASAGSDRAAGCAAGVCWAARRGRSLWRRLLPPRR